MAVIPWAAGMVLGVVSLRWVHLREFGMVVLVEDLQGQCLAMVVMGTLEISEMATV